jgi:solute carrier family 45, member 3
MTCKNCKLQVLLLPITVWHEVWHSPLVLWRLFVADTISWAAATSHALFYAHYVGQVVYAGHPNAPPESLEEDLYNEGVRMGSWGLLLHSISSCGYVLLLQNQLIQVFGLKHTYLFGLASFSVCMLGTLVVHNIWMLNIFAAFSGIGFAVMTSIPSALVTEYHADQTVSRRLFFYAF